VFALGGQAVVDPLFGLDDGGERASADGVGQRVGEQLMQLRCLDLGEGLEMPTRCLGPSSFTAVNICKGLLSALRHDSGARHGTSSIPTNLGPHEPGGGAT
jgi:hypothetical protein